MQELLPIIREVGAAGAVVYLAIWVIKHQGTIISENTKTLERLATLIERALVKLDS